MSVTPILPHNIPSVMFDDTPRARRTDSLTSHAAADGTTKKREHAYLLITKALSSQAPMTAQEIVQYIRTQLGVWISESRVTTSMTELRREELVVTAGTRKNPSGYHGVAYRLTDEVDA
ncbi:hypothetical protein [Microbacterium sp. 1P06AB]|uniref:hypothetical protein n=1 Tax=Microbacterium sp. 1P06AB TaxID=3132289 RepID=UPI0039A5F3E7